MRLLIGHAIWSSGLDGYLRRSPGPTPASRQTGWGYLHRDSRDSPIVAAASVSQNGSRQETYEPTSATGSLANPFDGTGIEIDVMNLHTPSEVGLVRPEVKRVMVATDRSHTASNAVAWAQAMAERCDAELWLVQVIIPSNKEGNEHAIGERTSADFASQQLGEYARELAGPRQERGCYQR